jgi:3-deoxy-7-phosphoheptulonate synthase
MAQSYNINVGTSALKKAGRKAVSSDTIIEVGGLHIGGPEVVVIAGPCAVENNEQLLTTAKAVRENGATILRGGAYKPRSSPYSFQGLEKEGLELLRHVSKLTGMPVITEIMDTRQVELVSEYADILQIGSRNMHNTSLLKEAGRSSKPVMIKRGMAATIEEFLLAAEYVMAYGNDRVILCERGIRTFEPSTRNTLDLSAIPMIKHLTHLPVIVDPSHGTGHWWMVPALAKAAIAVGADGIMVEVHHKPEEAMSDGAQSLTPDYFGRMMEELDKIAGAIGKKIAAPEWILAG